MSSAKKPAPASNDTGISYQQQVSKIQEYLEKWNQIRKNNNGDLQNPQSEACKAEIREFFKEHLKVKEKDVQGLIDNHYITVYKLIYDIYILDKVSKSQEESKSQDQKLTMKDINSSLSKIVYIQSILRRKIALSQYKKKLQSQKKELQQKLSTTAMPEEACMKNFAAQLADKKLTPEAFFRVCDQYNELKVPVPTFTKKLTDFGIVLTSGQQQRIINILDEDLEQVITYQEFFDAIEAYNISGEKHKNPNNTPYLPFEIRVLIKLSAILKERDLSAVEVFNSCDVDRSGTMKIDELAKFIEGISRDFKQKEAFALMRYLDVDNNGSIDKAEFQKQLAKVDKYLESFQRMQAAQFYQQSTGKITGGVTDMYQQSANLVKGSMGMASFKAKDTITGARDSAMNYANQQKLRAQTAIDETKAKATAPFREGFNSISNKWNNSPVRGWFGSSDAKQEEGPGPQNQKAPAQKASVQKASAQKPSSAPEKRQSSKPREVIEDDLYAEEVVGGGDQALAYSDEENQAKGLAEILPNHYAMSPRSKQDELAQKIYIILRNKNFKPQTVFRMADAYNSGEVSSKQLVTAFCKLLPEYDASVFAEACKAFGKKGVDGDVTKEDFSAIFEPDQRERDFVPKSNTQVASDYNRGRTDERPLKYAKAAEPQMSRDVDPGVSTNWIKRLDDAMLKEGISPKVAFLNADLNGNGMITIDELRQALKELLPSDEISLADIKKMAMAFDVNRNGSIDEAEFLLQFQHARQQPVVTRKVVAHPMEEDPEFPGETVRHSSPAISKKKGSAAQKGSSNPLEPQMVEFDKTVLKVLRSLEAKIDVKEVLSQMIQIDDEGCVPTSDLSRSLKAARTQSGAILQELEYLPILAFLERGHKGSIRVADLIKLLQQCQNDSEQEGLIELMFMGWALDNIHKARSTIMFLSQKTKIQRNSQLNYQRDMPKFIQAIGVQATTSSMVRLCQIIEEAVCEKLTFESFCNDINGHRKMEQNDEDLPEFDLSKDSAIIKKGSSPDDSVIKQLVKGKQKGKDLMEDSEEVQEEDMGEGDQAFAGDVDETENFIQQLRQKMPKMNQALNDFFNTWNNDTPIINLWFFFEKKQGLPSSNTVQNDLMFDMGMKKKGNLKTQQFVVFCKKHRIPFTVKEAADEDQEDEYSNFKENLRQKMPKLQQGIADLFNTWDGDLPPANFFLHLTNSGIEVSKAVEKDFIFETGIKKNQNLDASKFSDFCKKNQIVYAPKKAAQVVEEDDDQVDEYLAFRTSLTNKIKTINTSLNDLFSSSSGQVKFTELFKFFEKRLGITSSKEVQKQVIADAKIKKDGMFTPELFLNFAKKHGIPYKTVQSQPAQEEDEYTNFVESFKRNMKNLEPGINKLFVQYQDEVPIDNFFLQLKKLKLEVSQQAKQEFMKTIAVKKGESFGFMKFAKFCNKNQIPYNAPAFDSEVNIDEIVEQLKQVIPKLNEDINQMFTKFRMNPSTKALLALLGTKGKIKLEEGQRAQFLEEVGIEMEGNITIDQLLNFCKKYKIPFRPAAKKELSDWEGKMKEVLESDPNLKADIEELFRNNGYEVKFEDLLNFLETFDIKLPEEDEELEDEFDPEIRDTIEVENFNKVMKNRGIPIEINSHGVKGIMKKGDKQSSAKKKTVVLADRKPSNSKLIEPKQEVVQGDESVNLSAEAKQPRVKKSDSGLKRGSSRGDEPIVLATQKTLNADELQRTTTQSVSQKSVAVQKKEELAKQNSQKALTKDIQATKQAQAKEPADDPAIQNKYKEQWTDQLEDKQQKWNNSFIDWMAEKNMSVSYQEFFDWFENNYNMAIHDNFRKIVAEDIDADNTKKISIKAFTDFCDDYDIPFDPSQRIEKGDGILLEMDGETYQTDKDVDYYRGVDTILNSEKAAIFMAEHLYNKVPDNQLFFDDDFGPKTRADKKNGALAMYFDGVPPKGYADPEGVVWKFATELSDKPEQFIDDGAGSNDVKQGQLGDCWFIGALSVIATKDTLLRGGVKSLKNWNNQTLTDEQAQELTIGVYPPIFHKYRKKGLYVFRFFKDFLWRYVIVDMRIPVNEYNGLPVFARCTELHELWVPLIEKAYAKIHGCYQSLISGFLDDGLSDMTGQVSEKLTIQNPKSNTFPSKEVGDKDTFWKFLLERKADGCMMGCSTSGGTEGPIQIDGEPCGVLSGHAYGLIDVFEIPDPDMTNPRKTHRLLRIRNPWGKGEWKNKWSDESEQLDNHMDKLDAYFKTLPPDEQFRKGEDGTFLMCYSDWRSVYNKVFISVNFPDKWNAIRYSSMFEKDCSGGLPGKPEESKVDWAMNPQYYFEAKKDMEIFLSLGQDDGRRVQPNGKYFKFPYSELIHPICLTVCKVKGKQKVEKFDKDIVISTSVLKEHREVSIRIKVTKGHYIFVPAAREKGSEGPFFLSIYYDQPDNMIESVRIDKLEHHHPVAEEEEDVRITDFRMRYITERIPFMLSDEDNCKIETEVDIVGSIPEGNTSAIMQPKDEQDDFE